MKNKQELNNIQAIIQKFKNLEEKANTEVVENTNLHENRPQFTPNKPHQKVPPKQPIEFENKKTENTNAPQKNPAPKKKAFDVSFLNKNNENTNQQKKDSQPKKLNPNLQKNVMNIMNPPKKELLNVGKLNPNLQKNVLNIFQSPQKDDRKVGKLDPSLGGDLNLFGNVKNLPKEALEEITKIDLKTNYTSCCFLMMDAPEVFEQLEKTKKVSQEELFQAVQKHINTMEKEEDKEMSVMAFTESQVGFILLRDRLCYIDWKNFICQEIKEDKTPNHKNAHQELKKICKEHAVLSSLPALTNNKQVIENVNAVITEYLESAVQEVKKELEEKFAPPPPPPGF